MTKATESSGAQRKGNANLKPFKKGQSGNPGGIPKDLREVIALARSHTVTAITALAEIAGSPASPESARVSAANALLDRAWGKAKETVEISGQDGAPLGLVVTVVRPSE
ncbi:DUF5681 domain-containing protein [Gluconobacter sp. P1C6_b]|uniref:DUF5681 domain-containing protein n=1 Tax=Gluconobacter sp. P1C6_b TaxID=2762619 RepID=UPI001C05B077|nr:DUF5681 domain-containing protein [Gluconobacter sp. P1C6_b]